MSLNYTITKINKPIKNNLADEKVLKILAHAGEPHQRQEEKSFRLFYITVSTLYTMFVILVLNLLCVC